MAKAGILLHLYLLPKGQRLQRRISNSTTSTRIRNQCIQMNVTARHFPVLP
ncbi:hypothetical protein ABW19_dt0204625 [Dactylella cylindrospora]|nr:hypothetical protein ABW19_dt0204625 [Dactylella cylindrospora]